MVSIMQAFHELGLRGCSLKSLTVEPSVRIILGLEQIIHEKESVFCYELQFFNTLGITLDGRGSPWFGNIIDHNAYQDSIFLEQVKKKDRMKLSKNMTSKQLHFNISLEKSVIDVSAENFLFYLVSALPLSSDN